jgi:hypothetical protein
MLQMTLVKFGLYHSVALPKLLDICVQIISLTVFVH